MEEKRKTDRENRGELRKGMATGRGVKTEKVVILVAVAFFLGLIVGAVAALMKTPPLKETRQLAPPGQGEMPPVRALDVSQEIRMLEDLVKKDPENPDGWVRLGDVSFESGQYDRAVEAYAKALKLEGARADLLVKLGNAYFDSEVYEKAIEAYSAGLSLGAGNADVLTDLGIAYRRTKRPHEATKAFRKAAQIDANHLNSRYNLGVVLFHDLNDREGAIKAWEEFVQIAPSGERAEQVKHMVEALRNMSSSQ